MNSTRWSRTLTNTYHGLFLLILVMLTTPVLANSQVVSCPNMPDLLSTDPNSEERNLSSSLFCIDLFPTNRVTQANGTARLLRPWSPFGVTVTPEGIHRANLSFSIQDLPDPSDLGDYKFYIAWVAPLSLYPVEKLGVLGNGSHILGEISLNKYIILISAESSRFATEMTGPLVLRGRSPSSKMEAHDLLAIAPAAEIGGDPEMGNMGISPWPPPPMYPGVPMLPGVMRVHPKVNPFELTGSSDIPMVTPHSMVKLPNGGTLDLFAGLVKKHIEGNELTMLAFNGQHPGPLIKVDQGSTIFVNFTNDTPFPSAVHWHGVRLDNRFDGVPGVTQDPVLPGESFRYQIYFKDAGIYWYHPHHREDIQQELGLAGNILVSPEEESYYTAVDREEIIMIDDFLLSEGQSVPFGSEAANYGLMGRFGNLLLVNGEPEYTLAIKKGELVRFYFTNAANTRTFNLSFHRTTQHDEEPSIVPIKVIASDLSKFMQEAMVKNITLAPAERYVVEVLFDEPGEYVLKNHVQGINHRMGIFMEEQVQLGSISVSAQDIDSGHRHTFDQLRTNANMVEEIETLRHWFDQPPEHHLNLTLQIDSLAPAVEQSMLFNRAYFNPVEWTGTMPRMNWVTDTRQLEWILEDTDDGSKNMEIKWNFQVGEVAKIRIHNDANAFHAMQHPLHIHGQRFLVLEQDGVTNDNLVWKDTVLLPTGSTTDILLELSNPGQWMVHCHIAEHLESGMKFVFNVGEE